METGQSPEPESPAKHEDAGSSLPALEEPKYDPKKFEEEQRTERRCKAYEMRIIERKSYRQIAEALKVSVFTAHEDVAWIQQQRIKELVAIDKELVVKHDQVYEALLDKWLPFATRDEVTVRNEAGELELVEASTEANMYATDRVVKILAEQAKLHGLGQGSKIPGSAQDLGKAVGEHVLMAMTQLAQGRFNKKVVRGEVVTPELENATPD